MKRYLAPLSILALIAAGYVWAVLPSSNAQSYEPIRKAYDALAVKDSMQTPQLRVGDTFFPPSVSTLPTCDADTEPSILFDSSDNLYKGCSDLSGSFEWLPLGRDNDQDGIRNDFDGNPNTAFTFTPDDPFALEVTTTYSGTDAQVDVSGTGRYLAMNGTDGSCPALCLCHAKGDQALISFTTGTVTPFTNIGHSSNPCATVVKLMDFLFGSGSITSQGGLSGTRVIVTGATCMKTEDT